MYPSICQLEFPACCRVRILLWFLRMTTWRHMSPIQNPECQIQKKKKRNGTLKDFVLSSMTFGVLLIFIISPNNCCRWVASVKIPWAQKDCYHRTSIPRFPLLDGAFWFSAQLVLASIWPTSSPLPAWRFPFCGLELPVAANWLAYWPGFRSATWPLGPAHVIYRASAAQVSAEAEGKP